MIFIKRAIDAAEPATGEFLELKRVETTGTLGRGLTRIPSLAVQHFAYGGNQSLRREGFP